MGAPLCWARSAGRFSPETATPRLAVPCPLSVPLSSKAKAKAMAPLDAHGATEPKTMVLFRYLKGWYQKHVLSNVFNRFWRPQGPRASF